MEGFEAALQWSLRNPGAAAGRLPEPGVQGAQPCRGLGASPSFHQPLPAADPRPSRRTGPRQYAGPVAVDRYDMRLSAAWRPLFLLLGARQSSSFAEVGDGFLRLRFGLLFDEKFGISDVIGRCSEAVAEVEGNWLARRLPWPC